PLPPIPPGLLSSPVQAAPHKQWANLGVLAREIAEQFERLTAATSRKQCPAKAVTVLAREATMRFKPLHGIGIQHFAPKIRVVATRITAGENVREIGAAITRRHGGEVQPALAKSGAFEVTDIGGVGDVSRFQLVPRLVDDICRNEFSSRETLVEFLRGFNF